MSTYKSEENFQHWKKEKASVTEAIEAPPHAEAPTKIPFTEALKIPGIIAFSLSFFCIKLATTGIYYWFPTYL